MIEVICFDFDGVIRKGELFSNRLKEKYNIPIEETVSILKSQKWKDCQLGKKSIKDVWSNFPKKHNLNMTYKELINFWFSGEHIDKNIIKLIDKLHKKSKIILLTNNPSERLKFYDKQDSLFKHFDKIIISSDIGYFKTSPEATKLIWKNPKEVLVIDNSEKDLERYKENGFQTILYKEVSQLEKDLKKYNL